ncbi:MAG: S8 family serine peptidase [Bacteroidetes bacterium]|nr:S8 family serine peptidase [Bacteroidota bacterium]MCL5026259.1 S8 family serine peptidase [Chloroflexota bacterium]
MIHRSPSSAAAGLAVLLIALSVWGGSLGYASPPAPSTPEQASPSPARTGHPKLDSALAALVDAYQQGGAARARALAEASGLRLQDTRVRVIVEAADPAGSAEPATRAAGGSAIVSYGRLARAEVPISQLTALAEQPNVRRVRRPLRPTAVATGQGVALSGADVWQGAGYNGAGVKVAIVDLGFQGYTSLLGTELPATVNTACTQQPLENGERHGAAVAEIVHDMAPAASLYLVNINDEVDLGNAVDCLIADGVSVANHSVAWGYEAAGDGTGVVNGIVNRAVSGGIFWTNAAGNYQKSHWGGTWSDPDGNGWLNFAAADEINTIYAGGDTCVFLRWNDHWGTSSNDYDLYLFPSGLAPAYDSYGNVINATAMSTDYQNGTGDPLEWLCANVSGGYYDIRVKRANANGASTFDLLTYGNTLKYQTAAGSLPNPADNASPGMASVGAVPWSSPTSLESFSSEGPTTDGRIKPDLAGPDGVSSIAYSGSFYGTSASSPHVAGAAALVKQAFPAYTPANIRAYLESTATDLGTPGKDDLFGAGRLLVPAPITGTVAIGGHVGLQGRPAPPSSQWVITATLGIYPPGGAAPSSVYTPTTDASGNFTVTTGITYTNSAPGMYDVRVKGINTLARRLLNQPMTSTHRLLDFGTLKEGDADGDNYVNITDFSVLRSGFGLCQGNAGYDPRTDFNQDGCTTILDFSLLRTNFGQASE